MDIFSLPIPHGVSSTSLLVVYPKTASSVQSFLVFFSQISRLFLLSLFLRESIFLSHCFRTGIE